MPFLNEEEWQQVSPLLGNAIAEIKQYIKTHHCDINTANRNIKANATEKFEELTGMPDVHYQAIYHHRLAD